AQTDHSQLQCGEIYHELLDKIMASHRDPTTTCATPQSYRAPKAHAPASSGPACREPAVYIAHLCDIGAFGCAFDLLDWSLAKNGALISPRNSAGRGRQ